MNEKLKNYTMEPDPAVWEGIKGTLARRKAVRRASWAAAGLVAAGAVVLLAVPRNEEPPMMAELSAPSVVEFVPQPVAQAPVQVEPKATESCRTIEVKAAKVDEPKKLESPANVAATAKEAPVRAEAAVAATVVSRPAANVQNTVPVADIKQPVEPKAEETLAVNDQPAEINPPDKSHANAGVSNIPDMLLWFPNVFAPSSDNEAINRFRAQLNQEGAVVKDFRMAIYNRAGARVFFSNDINEAWDGTRDGQPLPQSAYVYVVFYTDSEGQQHHCKGTVTLVR